MLVKSRVGSLDEIWPDERTRVMRRRLVSQPVVVAKARANQGTCPAQAPPEGSLASLVGLAHVLTPREDPFPARLGVRKTEPRYTGSPHRHARLAVAVCAHQPTTTRDSRAGNSPPGPRR